MQPEIYAHKSRSGGKRGTSNPPVEVDVAAVYDPGDGVSDLLGVSENRGGTTPASKLGNMGSTSASRQPNSQPTSLRHITADRPIFTLSVAADLLGLHPRTLRIYEEKGLVVPARTHGNRRRYSQLDALIY